MLKDLHMFTTNFIVSCFITVFYPAIIITQWLGTSQNPFAVMGRFEVYDWILLFLAGLFGLLNQTFKAKALSLGEASKLTIYTYFSSVFQLVFDIAIFQTEFFTLQIIGMLTVFIVSLSNGVFEWRIGSSKTTPTK